ncbi:unnamed protein product [Closterium sp. NIES-54]
MEWNAQALRPAACCLVAVTPTHSHPATTPPHLPSPRIVQRLVRRECAAVTVPRRSGAGGASAPAHSHPQGMKCDREEMRVARGHYMYTVQTLALALVLAPPCYAIMAAWVPEEEHQRLPTHIHPFLPHLIPFVLQEVARAAKAKLKKRGGAGARGETRGGCLGYSPICSSCSPAGSPCGLYSVAGGGSSSQGQGEEAGRSRSEGGFPKVVAAGTCGSSAAVRSAISSQREGRWTMSGRRRAMLPVTGGGGRLGGVEGGRRGGSLAGDVKEGGDGWSTMSGERVRRQRAAKSASRHDRSKKSAWSNALSSRAGKKAQHGRPQLHERITETGGDTPLDLLDLSAPLLKPTHGTLSSGATGGGAAGGGSKRHRDGGGEREGERKDAGFEYTEDAEDGKMDVLNETEGGEGGTGGGSGRKGGAKKGVGAGEEDGEGNLDYGVMEDDDMAMGDASLASARAAELAFGRRVRGARGAKGGGEGGEGRGGAGAGGGGGRKKAKANSGQARPFLLVRTGAVGRSRLVAVAGGLIQGMNMPQAAGGVRVAM